jgi:hypothetical protein
VIDVDLARQKIMQLPPEKQKAAIQILQELNARKRKQKAQTNFLDYVYHVWPSFIHGKHHEIMAEAFERVARGELKRLIINMPPRHTKSEFASYLLPSWYLGKYPNKKVIQTSHTASPAHIRSSYHDIRTSFGWLNVFRTGSKINSLPPARLPVPSGA